MAILHMNVLLRSVSRIKLFISTEIQFHRSCCRHYFFKVLIYLKMENTIKDLGKLTLQGQGTDEHDARGFSTGLTASTAKEAFAPVDRNAECYKMNHKRRGRAIIFNNRKFLTPGLSQRNGTDADRDRLKSTLKGLRFDVEVYDDPTNKKIYSAIEDLASEDHSDDDCILIAVFSHGDLNKIHSYDDEYKPDRLWEPFQANRCPTLAGKPKIFLIQACQGDQLDSGISLRARTAVDAGAIKQTNFTIPNKADFVTVYSTVPGYYSWRNTSEGSWFIQSVCKVLKIYSGKKDFLSMLTIIAREVALNFESCVPDRPDMDRKKQVPLITSTLTRDVYF